MPYYSQCLDDCGPQLNSESFKYAIDFGTSPDLGKVAIKMMPPNQNVLAVVLYSSTWYFISKLTCPGVTQERSAVCSMHFW